VWVFVGVVCCLGWVGGGGFVGGWVGWFGGLVGCGLFLLGGVWFVLVFCGGGGASLPPWGVIYPSGSVRERDHRKDGIKEDQLMKSLPIPSSSEVSESYQLGERKPTHG